MSFNVLICHMSFQHHYKQNRSFKISLYHNFHLKLKLSYPKLKIINFIQKIK